MLLSSTAADGDLAYSMEQNPTNTFQVMQEIHGVTEASGKDWPLKWGVFLLLCCNDYVLMNRFFFH